VIVYSDGRAMRGQLVDHPDALVFPAQGRAFFAEFKRRGEQLRPGQAAWGARARRCGILSFLVRSVTGAKAAWEISQGQVRPLHLMRADRAWCSICKLELEAVGRSAADVLEELERHILELHGAI